jgi:heavy metal sensor kinase
MAAVLIGAGVFLYVRLESSLTATIDRGLDTRADDLATLVAAGSGPALARRVSSVGSAGESLDQVLDAHGRVLASSPGLEGTPALSRGEVERALGHRLAVDHKALPGYPGSWRLLVRSTGDATGAPVLVVVGAPLADRERELANFRRGLLIGGPIALLLASLVGYWVAAAALRPVDSMRRRATAISTARPGQQLPLPKSRDEIRHLGEALNDMLGRLEAAFARERRFVSDAGHELSTPLALLRTELELALRRERPPDELRQAVRSAIEENDRLARIAEDLLLLAPAADGTLPLHPERFEPQDLLARVAQRFEARASDQGRTIDVEPTAACAVQADPALLEQALGNLIENALRYGDGTIRLSALETDSSLELHVTDEGPGFPGDFLDRAFERFSRADPARRRGGVGLGLAIVDAIASAHGGSARAQNRPGGGADTSITLPGASTPSG